MKNNDLLERAIAALNNEANDNGFDDEQKSYQMAHLWNGLIDALGGSNIDVEYYAESTGDPAENIERDIKELLIKRLDEIEKRTEITATGSLGSKTQ